MEKSARSVRVVLVVGDVTYDVELAKPDDGRALEATLNLEHEDLERSDPIAIWVERLPTGNAKIELKAFGKVVKHERRQE